MKTLTTVIAATALAGLGTYAVLELTSAVALTMAGAVVVKIYVFVLTLAASGIGSAVLTLAVKRVIDRGDAAALDRLEERVARLERAAASPGAASPRPAGSAGT